MSDLAAFMFGTDSHLLEIISKKKKKGTGNYITCQMPPFSTQVRSGKFFPVNQELILIDNRKTRVNQSGRYMSTSRKPFLLSQLSHLI